MTVASASEKENAMNKKEHLTLVIATRNRKKIEELLRIMADLPVSLRSLDDFPRCPEVEEDAGTFEGNALKKARAVAAHAGLPAMSDDSGLVVDALGGSPGVYSARYAGDGAGDQENLEKLLRELRGVPREKRTGRFVCSIALAYPDGSAETFAGTVEGMIGEVARGRQGFGYDPVFFPEGHGRTFAEMSPAEKDAMSHRGRALAKLRDYLLRLASDVKGER
jgi:XTP/dITP diphosphohydrolase